MSMRQREEIQELLHADSGVMPHSWFPGSAWEPLVARHCLALSQPRGRASGGASQSEPGNEGMDSHETFAGLCLCSAPVNRLSASTLQVTQHRQIPQRNADQIPRLGS